MKQASDAVKKNKLKTGMDSELSALLLIVLHVYFLRVVSEMGGGLAFMGR